MPIVLHRVNSCFFLREKYSIEVIFVHYATSKSFRETGVDALKKDASEIIEKSTDLQFLSEVYAAFCNSFVVPTSQKLTRCL